MKLPVPSGDLRRIKITKLHIEEDAGKTKNEFGRRMIDFNRCGVPLVEMVTDPDLRSAEEAAQYLTRLRQLLRWIGVSEADMEKGHLRCDANVSIRFKGDTHLNPKTEIKNVNSILAVRDAIQKEIDRQINEVEAGRKIKSWTLEWDETSGTLRKMRSKETEADYRYFREPDLLPLMISSEWQNTTLAKLPELPLKRRERFVQQYNLPAYDAEVLTSERTLSDYFEESAAIFQGEPKRISNWLMNDVMRIVNEYGIAPDELIITPNYLVEIITLVDMNVINNSTGKALLEKVQSTGLSPKKIVESEGLAKVSDYDTIRGICQEVLHENLDQVEAYKQGKTTLIGWFVGQVMRKMGGKADPQLARTTIEEMLAQK